MTEEGRANAEGIFKSLKKKADTCYELEKNISLKKANKTRSCQQFGLLDKTNNIKMHLEYFKYQTF